MGSLELKGNFNLQLTEGKCNVTCNSPKATFD